MLKGSDVNQTPLYKALNPNLVQFRKFQWKLGWNESLTEPGLFFGTLKQITNYMIPLTFADLKKQLIGIVHVDDDELVTIVYYGYHAQHVRLDKIITVGDLSEEDFNIVLDGLASNTPRCFSVMSVEYITPERVKLMYDRDIASYKHLPKDMWPTEQQFIDYVKKNGYRLSRISYQTINICLAAIKNDYKCMRYVNREITKDIEFWKQAIPVTKGKAYRYVTHGKRATKDIRENVDLALLAVELDKDNLRFVCKKCRTPEVMAKCGMTAIPVFFC